MDIIRTPPRFSSSNITCFIALAYIGSSCPLYKSINASDLL